MSRTVGNKCPYGKSHSQLLGFPQHQADRRELDECEGGTIEVLEILGQPAAAAEPGQGARHRPAPRQNLKTCRGVGAIDDLDRKLGIIFANALRNCGP